MIYFVSKQKIIDDFTDDIKQITAEESLDIISKWGMMLQYDSETSGRDARICKLLCAQLGNFEGTDQIVIDCTTIDIMLYKEVLETHYLICHNGKFDLQFLYNYEIIPRLIYDTMIVEQFLYLGYPKKGEYGGIGFSLKDVAERRLGINIDKTVRGEIIWRGLDLRVIKYAAGDVVYLGPIMKDQRKDLANIPNSLVGAKLECDVVPAMAYLEWCGIKLDVNKWKAKMQKDKEHLALSEEALNTFVETNPKLKKFTKVNLQGDLFSGFDTKPHCTIKWSSSQQVIRVAKALGFNTQTKDKKTGEDKDSVLKKVLSPQKGICDKFLRLYFGQGEEDDEDYFPGYQGSAKVVSSFGQGHINAINPITGRIHTEYRQIGAASGRMSSGNSKSSNTDLAKLKGLPPSKCTYPNMQQLPKNAVTRGCFISEKDNLFCSCDYSAMEARIGAEVYNEHKLLDEFLYGSGDTHAAYAKVVFSKELEGIDTKDIKKKRPDLRSKVKSIEFAVQFGSDGTAVAPTLKIPVEDARKLVSNLLDGMKGLASFKQKGSQFVRSHGYVVIMPQTGHRTTWADWEEWKKRQASFTNEFWEDYKKNHKGTGDYIAKEVSTHFKAGSYWDRMALNLPTQGGGAVVLKTAIIDLYNWVIDNGYWGKILFVNFTHDEINSEFPKELKDTYPQVVSKIMEEAAAKYYHKLPIPAVPEVGDHWIH